MRRACCPQTRLHRGFQFAIHSDCASRPATDRNHCELSFDDVSDPEFRRERAHTWLYPLGVRMESSTAAARRWRWRVGLLRKGNYR